MTYRVCFVCTGNICRSPMAEHVFRARVEEAGLGGAVEVDSAGTGGWHEGDGADPRTVAVLEEHGYTSAHTARQFRASWFPALDLVIALDEGHLRELRRLARTPDEAAKVRLLRSYDPAAGNALDVPDPYYGGREGFEECLEMTEAASEGLLAAVRAGLGETLGSSGQGRPRESPGRAEADPWDSPGRAEGDTAGETSGDEIEERTR